MRNNQMYIDQQLFYDLGFLHQQGGIFKLMDTCITTEGSDLLKHWLLNPLKDITAIHERQAIVSACAQQDSHLGNIEFTNGTMVMIDDFLKSDQYQLKPNAMGLSISQWFSKWFQRGSKEHVTFHYVYIAALFNALNIIQEDSSKISLTQNQSFQKWKIELDNTLSNDLVVELLALGESPKDLQKAKILYAFKKNGRSLLAHAMQVFAQWDAWQALAKLLQKEHWVMPEIEESKRPYLHIENLYFPAIDKAKGFDLNMDHQQHFLLLTGANMSGKSTFLRTLGMMYVLGQMGAPVPATSAKFSKINGLITNLSVKDDIYKGESFFYAEVKSMKTMAEHVSNANNYLFLMDELFKGTNIQDAYESTELILKSLQDYQEHLFILSTHIYELAKEYKHLDQVRAVYMETIIDQKGDYSFTYHLKEGVSDDKIGAIMLRKEGIFDILK